MLELLLMLVSFVFELLMELLFAALELVELVVLVIFMGFNKTVGFN